MIQIENCRACGSKNLIPILSLGNQYVTNFIDSEKEQENIPQVPLDIILCDNCKLLQIKHNAPPESMWGDQYWYQSGISSTIKDDLKDIVEKSQTIKKLNRGDVVLDIGCNDGTLLDFYDKKEGIELIGFEPSGNVAEKARKKGFKVIRNFFNANNFWQEFGDKKAKIITAISMFYDLEDPNKFLDDIAKILDKNGLFVIQQNYLVAMLEQNAFDNICHEHREYYSFISLRNILDKHGLEIFDIEQNNINGGSIRTYIKFKDNPALSGFNGAKQRIEEITKKEMEMKLDTSKPYTEFARRIDKIKIHALNFLTEQKKLGKKIAIYGASTRGNVILQYFGLGPGLIDYIADKNSDKWGKRTVGTLIPIISPEEMREAKPDYLFVNTWHFLDEIMKQEYNYSKSGGKFIVALPQFKVIGND